MQLSHIENQTKEVEVLDNIICNICGEPIKITSDIAGMSYDYIHIHQEFGYRSNHDNQTHDLDICEDCYSKLINSCKIQPTIIEKEVGYEWK